VNRYRGNGTVESHAVGELTALDLVYAPPFSPAWDPILVAVRQPAAAARAAR